MAYAAVEGGDKVEDAVRSLEALSGEQIRLGKKRKEKKNEKKK